MASDWPLTPDGQYRQAEVKALLPVDPSGVGILMIKPDGGAIGVGVTAVEKGDPGVPAELATAINFTALEPTDPTPDSASFTVLTPPTSTTPGVYKLNLALHKGEAGDDGNTVLDTGDFEDVAAGKVITVNSAADGFELQAPKIPEVFYPGSIADIPSGNVNFTVTTIAIPARPYARRVRAGGYQVLTGEAADVRVDLLARLGSAAGGNIVGRCQGIAQIERLTLDPGKPIEVGTAADTYDQIAANAAATVYIRTERTSGTSTYTGSASQGKYWVEVLPL